MPTTTPLTNQDLADIRARLDAASPGPWEFVYEKTEADLESIPYRQCSIWVDGADYIVPPLYDRGYCWQNSVYRDRSMEAADAEFTAAARQDVERLLAEVERLRRLTSWR